MRIPLASEKAKMILHEKFDLYQNVERIKYEDRFVSYSDVKRAEQELTRNIAKYYRDIWENEKIDQDYKRRFGVQ